MRSREQIGGRDTYLISDTDYEACEYDDEIVWEKHTLSERASFQIITTNSLSTASTRERINRHLEGAEIHPSWNIEVGNANLFQLTEPTTILTVGNNMFVNRTQCSLMNLTEEEQRRLDLIC